ncbi:MAG TPA: hypothetical protein VFM97_11080 [Gammaproteobacteria bacterium]|nr:hypothetical protein [Gammaproteobacteria bacterium]
MPQDWAERERRTNHMVRALAEHVFSQRRITPRNLYGLARLAWITGSYDEEGSGYITSVKIPALGDSLGQNFDGYSLDKVAKHCANAVGSKKLPRLVRSHTGFTNFYNAYRNSAFQWLKDNHDQVSPLFQAAFSADSHTAKKQIVRKIAILPGIPKPHHPDQKMRPEYFLTPAFFCLDPELTFPLINGNGWVQSVLEELGVTSSSLEDQFDAMYGLIGHSGIRDAADLDQVGRDMPDEARELFSTSSRKNTRRLLKKKNTGRGRSLSLKDEEDVNTVRKAITQKNRQIHNKLTNRMLDLLQKYSLLEGDTQTCMFDVLIKNYDSEKNDLLVEVKSSSELANIRMAIDQLYSYWHSLKKNLDDPHLAVLVPDRPDEKTVRLLQELDIGILWLSANGLNTDDEWLKHLASAA